MLLHNKSSFTSNTKELIKQYRNFPENENEKQREYGREQYRNLLENEKERLVEYKKKYYKIWKNKTAA